MKFKNTNKGRINIMNRVMRSLEICDEGAKYLYITIVNLYERLMTIEKCKANVKEIWSVTQKIQDMKDILKAGGNRKYLELLKEYEYEKLESALNP